MENMKIYNAVRKPPEATLKKITGGRLSGMTDIKPQWRYESLTEQFGPCGIGWKFEIVELWIDKSEQTHEEVANAKIYLYIKYNEKWSDPIPGVGGSMFCAKEKAGPHTSDEAYKMAITDALSTACKMLGFGADIYLGMWDGSKYRDIPQSQTTQKPAPKNNAPINERPKIEDNKKKVMCPDNTKSLFGKSVAEVYCVNSCKEYNGCQAYEEVPSDEIPF